MKEKNLKRKFALWIRPSILEEARRLSQTDEADCHSVSEYIGEALDFYNGYIASERNMDYFGRAIVSTMNAIIAESNTKINRMIFKLAVELAVTMNIVACVNDIDPESVKNVRRACVQEVKKSNGGFRLEDAIAWQRGDEEDDT